ncbi:allantoate amidohydrolase [Secundilactobacillus pentosiphilus]|uniref:Allantoate amidohydrolase n=1 Tax=Secundilactobacillus pentosiphilus TaxID=1714682 RepID=A0A1Z5IME1_9LACO|nr:M20 family metallo-hydrolase [Secundilactobacillus pentosiphilus]GAX02937.1 allantoate amidohydrolase [Secundilactobacillus pentosiphilus]
MIRATSTWLTFKRRFQQICQLSDDTIGQNRLVYSPNWIAAQSALIHFGQQIGLTTIVDNYGNVYLDLPGKDNQVIATGSHMDTVINGGRYDGLYGVLGGLQALHELKERFGTPQHTLRLISFSEEEGSRFKTTFSGSKYYALQQTVPNLTDSDGVSFEHARRTAVSQLQALKNTIVKRPVIPASFTELHIEQGPRLVTSQDQIGLVSGIVGQRRFTVTVKGQSNHAGTTPMNNRHDALQTAVNMITRLERIAHQLSDSLTFTVGQLTVSPNASNVIPGTVCLTIDVRHADDSVLNQFEQSINECLNRVTDPLIKVTANRYVRDLPAAFDTTLLSQNEQIARRLGLSARVMVSGAGHDSYVMNQVSPTTMIFVPSEGGISHAPNELTHPADLKAGIKLLMASLHAQAY